jgi:UDP-3-O-[3-hydroxymyristoyl] N-acetylglucosamine deacetylase
MTTPSCAAGGFSMRQHTLGQSTQWRTGALRRRRTDMVLIHPADPETGIRFVYPGVVRGESSIAVRWDAVVDTRHGIVLGNPQGATLRGVIPLLAALRVAGIDNAVVQVNGAKIPADAGDFDLYLRMLSEAGIRTQAAPRRLVCVTDTIEARDSLGSAILSPATAFRACASITLTLPNGYTDTLRATLRSDFGEPYGSARALPTRPRAAMPTDGIDPGLARPLREIDTLAPPLRAAMVEMIGHLALAGPPVAADLRCHGSGAQLYPALMRTLMERRAFSATTVDEQCAGQSPGARGGGGAGPGCPTIEAQADCS